MRGYCCLMDRDYMLRIKLMVDKSGWMGQAVDGDGDDAPFLYTVGLYRPMFESHPELIIFGLPPQLAHTLITTMVDRIKGGARFGPGDVVSGVVRDFSLAILEVDEKLSIEYLRVANSFYRDAGRNGGLPSTVPAVQVVFPDSHRRWPWQDQSDVRATPLLGQIPESLK